jgi:hypothetical protein
MGKATTLPLEGRRFWQGGAWLGLARLGWAWRGNNTPPKGGEDLGRIKMTNDISEITKETPWRVAIATMRAQETYGYGATWDTPFFEKLLAAKRDTADFAFGMMDLRAAMEAEDGYYLRAQTIDLENEKKRVEQWVIPAASEHEGVARMFEGKMNRYARRSVNIRALTLANKDANLSDADKSKMESALRIASTRLVLLRREQSIGKWVEKNAPKLLK